MQSYITKNILKRGLTLGCSRRAVLCSNVTSFRAASSTTHEEYDIVIAGGGMVGFAMASSLGQSKRLAGLRILLLETSPIKESTNFPNSWQIKPYSNRVCAISQPSQKLLSNLGAWKDILSIRSKSVTNMQVWESESDSHIAFGDGKKTVADIVENDIILESLKQNIPSTVEVRYSCSADSYNLPKSVEDKACIHLLDGSTVATSLLIGCDGASSLVRKTMGGQYLSWHYDQMGVVATLQLENDENEKNSTAWQKFLPTGPIALLPLTHNLSSLVWCTSKSNAKTLLTMDNQSFTEALNSALWSDGKSSMPPWLHEIQQNCTNFVRDAGRMLSPVGTPSVSYKQLPPSVVGVTEGSRAAFPLGLGHAIHYTRPRVALLGDAAHRVHPLAGQGVNLGFSDVSSLTRSIESAVMCGEDVGNPTRLQQYETERQRENVLMMAAIDSLHRLYTTNFAPAVFMRSVGLSAVDAIQPIKRKIESFVEKH